MAVKTQSSILVIAGLLVAMGAAAQSAEDRFSAWSPDGTKIAFNSDRDGNSEIYVMNADGSNPTRLTNNPDSDSNPSWSP